MADIVIQTSGLGHHYGAERALDAVDLQVSTGEVVALLGNNGAGKTTLMRLLAGLLPVQDGSIQMQTGAVGYCPQATAIWDDLTVREQLEFMAAMYEVSPERVEQVAAEVGLSSEFTKLGSALSGGMRRRLSIAIATLHRPGALILDEPEVGLDPSSRIALRKLIRERADSGIGVLLSSHTMDEVERIADRVVVLEEGRIVETGTPAELAGDGRLEDRFHR